MHINKHIISVSRKSIFKNANNMVISVFSIGVCAWLYT